MILYQDRSYDTQLCASRLSLFVVQDCGPMILQKCGKLGFWDIKYGSKPDTVASKTRFLISFRVLGCKKLGFLLLKSGFHIIHRFLSS